MIAYKTPVLRNHGSMTKLTSWNDETMICSDATFFSGTSGSRPIDPSTGNPFTHSGWYAYAEANDCTIIFP